MDLTPFDDTNNRNFVRCVLESEDACIEYLKTHGLFDEAPRCPGRRNQNCGGVMEERRRRSSPVWRCTVSSCQTYRSFACSNDFFIFTYENKQVRRQLKFVDIVQISWLWCYSGMTIAQAAKAAGVAKQTLCNWYAKCRHICSISELTIPKMKGTQTEPIQVDESYFSGRRKYNRGRLAKGDKRSSREYIARTMMEIELSGWGDVEPCTDAVDEVEVRNYRTNYGNQVVGPWVVGLYKSAKEVRFHIVPDRTAATLRSVVSMYCEPGSYVVTDEWAGYRRLCDDGFLHKTVNHSQWFVNPADGFHTQGIERMWVDGKAILKRHRRPTALLQSHLDEVAWRKRYRDCDRTLLSCFWDDVRRTQQLD